MTSMANEGVDYHMSSVGAPRRFDAGDLMELSLRASHKRTDIITLPVPFVTISILHHMLLDVNVVESTH